MASSRFICRHVFIVRCKLASLLTDSVLHHVSLTCVASSRLLLPTIARLVLTYAPLVYKNTLLARIRGAILDHSSSRASNHSMSTDELVRAAPPALTAVVREVHRAAEAHTNSVEVFPMLAAAVLMAYALFLIAMQKSPSRINFFPVTQSIVLTFCSHIAGIELDQINAAASLFLLSRIAYLVLSASRSDGRSAASARQAVFYASIALIGLLVRADSSIRFFSS